MKGFEYFDPRCWVEKGLVITLPQKPKIQHRGPSRPKLKTYFLATATAVVLGLSAPSLSLLEPSSSVVNWTTSTVGANNLDKRNSLSNEYWSKLVSVMQKVPILPEDDYSFEPESII